ncbi:MAG: hypothetical protein LBF22_14560 [Deltaproteobacteria bacterium]|nr:hypothetical protein [Deltaproteobacteria bacterium]
MKTLCPFASAVTNFPYDGPFVNQDSATLGIQGMIRVSERVNLSLNYDGAYGKNSMSHTGSAALSCSW